MAELRVERERLSREIMLREVELQHQYTSLKQSLSIGAIVSSAIERIEIVRSIILKIYDGYRFAQSFIRRKSQTPTPPPVPQEQNPEPTINE